MGVIVNKNANVARAIETGTQLAQDSPQSERPIHLLQHVRLMLQLSSST